MSAARVLPDYENIANDALNRMKRASDRGTGCHLTAEMIAALNVTQIGELWDDADPRVEASEPTP